MGREKRQKAKRAADTRIRMDELDYLRIVRARGVVNEAILQGRAEVEQAQGVANQRLDSARVAYNDALKKVAGKYGLDLSRDYTFDDQNNALVLAADQSK